MVEPGERVLVVTAHPDDAEFHFGATIAALTDAGADVRYLICSDGAQGEPVDATTPVRMDEQRAAAAVLGVREVRFLGLPDGCLEPTLALRREITAQIRRDRPALVLTHYPRRVLDIPIEASHPDHIAVGEATLAAVYPDADNPRACPELARDGLGPHRVREVWVPGYERPNHFVDATPYIDRKSDALRQHRSQTGGEPPAWVFEWMRQAGRGPGYDYAEHYRRIAIG
ncbi:PIG-L deacetylase family protein [Actinoplanes aureus]|jgi:LmbE family N-acetylglucosaminyl deacetylase|uniref:PIG-L family deacetylase n=1 Tax=Actinoplanes aureus TaxID=2792083 RepID=A0A931CDQ4_9ACTN|nr:PIG-L deacetylase family protein [Actinoplanes aureus]MBG0566087.1 PIG-L family deacetylase [Actinoplanes aureus]